MIIFLMGVVGTGLMAFMATVLTLEGEYLQGLWGWKIAAYVAAVIFALVAVMELVRGIALLIHRRKAKKHEEQLLKFATNRHKKHSKIDTNLGTRGKVVPAPRRRTNK